MNTQDLTLLTDLYELTMMQGYYYKQSQNETVVFDVFLPAEPVQQRIFHMRRAGAGHQLHQESELYLRGYGLSQRAGDL